MKGAKGQLNHEIERDQIQVANEQIGFKCLHYSVTESNGKVELTIVKKVSQMISVGLRTVESTAKEGSDFEKID